MSSSKLVELSRLEESISGQKSGVIWAAKNKILPHVGFRPGAQGEPTTRLRRGQCQLRQ